MASQNSIISYVPQPYFIDIGQYCQLWEYYDLASIDNAAGALNPDLSNYTTINADVGVSEFGFQVWYNRTSAHLVDFDMCVALIGCALLTYEDVSGAPDLESEFSEDINAWYDGSVSSGSNQRMSYVHNSPNNVTTFCQTPLPGIISGGRSNLIWHGLGKYTGSNALGIAHFHIVRSAADTNARPHAKFVLGHVFIGVDLPVTLDPRSFAWTLESQNRRFVARDTGTVNSEGTLVRQASGEIIKIANSALIGSTVTDIASEVVATPSTNFFDLIKINTSYPVLFNPFPVASPSTSTVTTDSLNLTARQNFFSIYGFLDGPLEFNVGEFRDGLASEYRARFRIKETR